MFKQKSIETNLEFRAVKFSAAYTGHVPFVYFIELCKQSCYKSTSNPNQIFITLLLLNYLANDYLIQLNDRCYGHYDLCKNKLNKNYFSRNKYRT